MQKISWADIFSLDDKSTITDAISVIQQLQQVYQGMIAAVQSSNSQLDSNIGDLKDQCDLLSKSIQAIGTNFDGNKTLLIDAAGQSQKLVDQYGSLIKAQNDNALSLDNLNKSYNTLGDTQDQIKKKVTDQAGSLNDLKTKIDEAVKSFKSLGDATDQSIKDSQLQKIKDLNTQYLTLNKALTDAKKATDVAVGSYNQLQAQVAAATKELKAMEGGMDTQGAKFVSLQKFVSDGNTKLKEFDAAIGMNQRSVGDYGLVVDKLDQQFGGLGSQAKGLIPLLEGVFTPIGAAVAIIGLGVASVSAFFTRTQEGALEAKVVTSELHQVWSDFMNVVSSVGGSVWNAFKDSAPLAFSVLQAVSTEAAALAKKQEELEKARISAIVSDSKTELEANQLLFNARNKVQFSDEQRLLFAQQADAKFKDIADGKKERAKEEYENAVKQLELDTRATLFNSSGRTATFEEQTKIANLKKAMNDAEDEYFQGSRRRQTLIQTEEIAIEKRKEEAAKMELDYTKDLNTSIIQADVDKNNAILANLKSSEDQRKEALIKNAQDEDQIAKNNRDKAIAQATQAATDRAKAKSGAGFFTGVDDQTKQKVLDMDKAYGLELQKINQDYSDKILTIDNSLNKSLVDNANKYYGLRLDSQTKLFTADVDAKKALEQSNIEFNQRIVNSDDATYEQRNQAIKNISEEKIKILGLDADKAIEIATNESKKKIYIDGLEAQHNQELSAQTSAILEKYQADVDKVNTETLKAVKENVFTVLNRDLTNLNNTFATQKNNQLDKLAEQYQAGNLTVTQYETQRAAIVRNSEVQQAKDIVDMYQKILDTTNLSEKQRTDIEAKAAAAREKAIDLEVNYSIAKRKELNTAILALGNEMFTAAKQISTNLLNDTLAKNQAELNALTTQRDAKLAIVGNDAAAQARIQADFNSKTAQLTKEANAAKRRDAIFQKEIDATKVITDTAVGVARAISMDNIPLAYVLGSMGAVELAAVLSVKIPSYGAGTESAKEGWSLVGENKRELGFSNGKATMYDKPTIAYLEQGTKIFNNPETEKIMESLGTIEDVRSVYSSYNIKQSKAEMLAVVAGNKEIVNTLHKTSDRMIKAMGKGTQDVWDETGYHRYWRDKNSRIERLDKRYTLGG